MCSKLGSKKDVIPGTYQVIKTRKGTQLNIYGFAGGSQYNARLESMNNIWKKLRDNRGIFQINSFWEKDKEFVREDHKRFNIAVLYNLQDEFAILTTDSNPVVKPFHRRMPVCLTEQGVEDFLQGKDEIEQLPSGIFILSNSKVAA